MMTRSLIAFPFVLSILALSCSTTGFAGLARESYAVEIDQKTSAEIQKLEDEVKNIKAVTDQLDTLLRDFEQTKQTTKEFRETLEGIQERMKSMPRENLEKLVEIIQKYLDETK
jgi:biopolymer transport protein ExbB/TolQ